MGRKSEKTTAEKLRDTAGKLWNYCREKAFSGYDPYDALNSDLWSKLGLNRSRFMRLVLIQGLKRLPVNLRPLLGIKPRQNPKALAIFLRSALKLDRLGIIQAEAEIDYLIKRISELRSPDFPYCCWGYSFPWQTRELLVPAGYPNLVCTVFVAEALLDAYEERGKALCLELSAEAADYIHSELYWEEGETAGLSYPLPCYRRHIYNADLLGAAFLARIGTITGKSGFLEKAQKIVQTVICSQNQDGSWFYGETPEARWIDNFHTGYNLLALKKINSFFKSKSVEKALDRGLSFYLQNFFLPDGRVRYFSQKIFPIDSHTLAMSLITLLNLRDRDERATETARGVLHWTLSRMLDRKGYFYYQKNRFCTNKIPYMRWSQAWMLLALSCALEVENEAGWLV